jgi:ATP-dependent helicase/nuclease subunit A
VLQQLIESQQVFEWAATEPDTREIWRRLRFVVDQARAWSDSGGHGLRHYLQWVRLHSQDGRFASEAVLPETDQDVVRIMTIHASKGLEFPITIVTGLTTRPRTAQGAQVVWTEAGWTILDRGDQTYVDFVPVDEQMSDAERARLWYVACTRARDHLVVSTHRVADANYASAASRLAEASAGVPHRHFQHTDDVLPPVAPSGDQDDQPFDAGFWVRRAEMIAAASAPRVLSATAIATAFTDDPGLRKGAVDLDLPPWQRGRYGTEVGRAVHAVLQYADLDTGADIDLLATAQAAAEGVLGLEERIASLARSAIATETVRAGIRGQHWRELFVAVQIGDRVIEGYIDLLVRRDDGSLVVVDYKTDRLPAGHDAPQRLQQYSRQLAAYGVALEEILHEPVAAGVLVMCHESAPASEVWVDDWQALCNALRGTLVR